jgi:hypothetical protein
MSSLTPYQGHEGVPEPSVPEREAIDAAAEPGTLEDELMRLRRLRDGACSLREMAEWCVAIEEAMGGRPPTRAFQPGERPPTVRE